MSARLSSQTPAEPTRDKATAVVGLGCATMVLSIPLLVLARGFVLSVLWRWFVAGHFNLPPLGIAESYGLSILVSVFTVSHRNDKPDPNDRRSATRKILTAVGTPLGFLAGMLALGYVVHLFAH